VKRSILICALLATAAPWQAKAVLATGINAIVHDSVITYEQVTSLTEQTADVLRRQYSTQPAELQKRMSKAREENLQRLADRELILHEFKTAGYSLPDSVINDMVEARLRAAFGDRRTAAKTLQARGMTYEKFREQERERFIVDAMRNKNISSEIMISPQKIQNYYQANQDKFKLQDQVKMRLIVRSKSKDPQAPDARALCEEILLQLKGGAPFEEMATLYSQGAEAKKGGERPWDTVADLRPELAGAVGKLNAGDLSDVIDTPDTCYIVKIEEKKAAHVKPLTDVREEIERDLLAQERGRLEKQWIEKLKRKTFVRYFP
jgi:peptidyl-prolyl cis-trans isomerase SurA